MINKDNRIAILAKQGQILWHTQDLMVLWNIYNKNTLYMTISRYCKRGILFRLQKGLYTLFSPQDIDPLVLANHILRGYSYITTETVLAQNGIINQLGLAITLVSEKSLKLNLNDNFFISRKLADKYLFNPLGVIIKNNIRQASVERAVADMLYFNPHFYFDNQKLIDWKKVRSIQSEIKY